jgi:hypothetical protein
MTKPTLMLIQSAFVRIACARRTGRDLRGLRHSLEQACGLPPGETWLAGPRPMRSSTACWPKPRARRSSPAWPGSSAAACRA